MDSKIFQVGDQPIDNSHANPLRLATVQSWALLEGEEGGTTDQKKNVRRIHLNAAQEWNQKGYGIFHTVNGFYRLRRKSHLARVNAWFVEVDSEDKKTTIHRIKNSGLCPSMIIESKRGFHVYWACFDPSFQNSVKSWDRIVKRGLIPFYGADPKASDVCRILRTPGFFHQKDRANPFLVRKVYSAPCGYTIRQMMKAYPDQKEKDREHREYKKIVSSTSLGNDFWSRVYQLNCEVALKRLSGSPYVGSETFSFYPHADGSQQIVVNGKPSSCWIDPDGKIGSYEKGGPSIAQWLNWYHRDYSKVAQMIEEVFPECKPTTQLQLSL